MTRPEDRRSLSAEKREPTHRLPRGLNGNSALALICLLAGSLGSSGGFAQVFDYAGNETTTINPATVGNPSGTINILPGATARTQGVTAIHPDAGAGTGSWTINVDGSVKVIQPPSEAYGVWLRNGGAVNVGAGGEVVGGTKGILIEGAPGQVVNLGRIEGDMIGVHILNGGSVENNAIIRGGVVFATSANQGTFLNNGSISSQYFNGFGVLLNSGGSFRNNGSIELTNAQTGFSAHGDTLFRNDGTLTAQADASYSLQVYGALFQQGNVTATNSGTIAGRDLGFRAYQGASASLVNTGTISAGTLDAVRLEPIGTAQLSQSAGSILGARHGVYTNTSGTSTIAISGGTVTGGLARADGVAVVAAGSGPTSLSVENATLTAPSVAIRGGPGAFDVRLNGGSVVNGAIEMGTGSSTLQMDVGAIVTGNISGGPNGQSWTVTGAGQGVYQGDISGFANGVFNAPGAKWTLNGSASFGQSLAVDAGTLVVQGAISAPGGVVVGAGGTIAGSGSLPSLTMNGTLSPGNSPGTLTVNGNLVLNAGSTYVAEVQGAVADRVAVTGTAALAGTLRLVPLGGPYNFNSPYTLLSAAAGRTGTFGTVDRAGTFGAGVSADVSYTANDVQLTLSPNALTPIITPRLGVAAPVNAAGIASAIDAAVAAGANPSSLFGIYNQPAAGIPAAVNSLSGEVHTAPSAMAATAADQFLNAMLDPYAAGRFPAFAAAGPRQATYANFGSKPAQDLAAFFNNVPFYSIWGAALSSRARTDGNGVVGSTRRQIDDAQMAAGIDIRLLPGTGVGIAVSGGSSQASTPGLLGKASADLFQAGLYGTTQVGPVKLGAAASYAWLDNDVSRSIPALGTNLASSYATTAWSGRLQASSSLLSWNGLTVSPLAAIQTTWLRNPAVVEANWAGANAGALAIGARNDVVTRSELGFQIDADGAVAGLPITGYVRAAWAHRFQRDANLAAGIIGLPGANFSVAGAQANRNSALLSAGIKAKLSERVSVGLSLDGDVAANSSRLGGSAQLKVSF